MKREFIKIKDIRRENSWINLKARVFQLWNSESESISQIGLLGDETGTIKFITWKKSNHPLLEEGKCYEFKNLVTGSWQGKLQVNLNKNTIITPIDENIEVSFLTKLHGKIIRIYHGSGLIKRRPFCKRALINEVCPEHGNVEGIYDLRVKALLKDNDIQDILLNRDVTEHLIGIDLEKAKELGQKSVLHKIEKSLLNKFFNVEGRRVGRYILVENICDRDE